ncbi:hypothetical protein [Streptomyces sp. NPDC058279]|uniref:hypothetical protein n=1 Tax=Streptomyces sp. NPDC058279 TaxID=3346418 RepID=UPI0036E55FC9
MPNTLHQPAAYRLVPSPDGQSIVAQVVQGHHFDGETLAARLYEYYVHRQDDGDEPPAELTIDAVMQHLDEQTCTEGPHASVNEPADEAAGSFTCLRARDHVERLFPCLAWKIQADQRHATTGEHRA